MKIYITANSSINPLSDGSDNRLPEALPQTEGNRLFCREPDYKSYIEDAGTRRRMSRAVKMGVAAARQCLASTKRYPDAIITATGLGCLADTEKFLKNIIANNEQLLNPTPFIQSTFNTVGAQTAISLKNTGYNMTYAHRNSSFESALLDAVMKLKDREAENVLTGSYEETTDTSFRIMERLGFWRHEAFSGEGAHFFMLSAKPDTSPYIELKGILCLRMDNTETTAGKLCDFLKENNLDTTDIDLFFSGRNNNMQGTPFYSYIEKLFQQSTTLDYKLDLGDYPTVSAGALWLAIQILTRNGIPGYFASSGKGNPGKHALIHDCFQGDSHTFMLVEKVT